MRLPGRHSPDYTELGFCLCDTLWGSKTGHRWLTCGFAFGSGPGAGSIAVL